MSTSPAPSRGSRRGLLLAAVLISAAAAVTAVLAGTGPLEGTFGDTDRARSPIVDQGGVARGGVQGQEDTVPELLTRRAEALVAKDRQAFLATVDPRDAELVAAQGTWFDNLADVPLGRWAYDLVTRSADPLPVAAATRAALDPDAFGSFVDVALRVADYDNADSVHQEVLVFTPHEGRWYVGGRYVAPGRANRQLWDVGKVHAFASEHALVLGLPPVADLRPIASEVERAVPRVDEVWGTGWSRRVLVLVTRTEDEMAELLGGKPAAYTQLAAITRGELGVEEGTAAAERVVINPRAYAELSDVGRRVIMTHEITHVAVRAVTQEWTPMWLAEGFADYIGYRGSGLSVRFIAQELVADLERGVTPATLPADAEFDTTNAKLPQAYEMAWLACRMIAERQGQDALLEFVRAAGAADGSAASVEDAFATVLGTTAAAFARDWLDYLKQTLS